MFHCHMPLFNRRYTFSFETGSSNSYSLLEVPGGFGEYLIVPYKLYDDPHFPQSLTYLLSPGRGNLIFQCYVSLRFFSALSTPGPKNRGYIQVTWKIKWKLQTLHAGEWEAAERLRPSNGGPTGRQWRAIRLRICGIV